MTSWKNIKICDFNGVNVAKHWHVAGRGICHLWLPCCPCCTCVCSVSRPWKFGTNGINTRTTGPRFFFWILATKSPCQIASIFYKYIDMGKISIHLSKLLKQGYSSRKLQTTFQKLYGRHTDLPCSQIWHFCVTYVEGFVHKLWHMTGSQLLFLNESWRVPHVRQEILIPEHLISLPLGSSRFHPFMIYTLQNLSVLGLCLRIHDWFVSLD